MPYPLELNPHRHYYPTRKGRILGIVLHVTAGAEDTGMVGPDGSAEGTIRYGQTTDRAASWHGIVDTDTVVDCLPDHYTAFHCKGVNAAGLGLEIANRDAKWAGKPARWVDATLANAAAWCAPRVARYGLPVRLATAAEVEAAIAAGRPFGFTYHSRMDPSRRVDPGADFPWARFAQLLTTTPTAPAQEDDMAVTPSFEPDVRGDLAAKGKDIAAIKTRLTNLDNDVRGDLAAKGKDIAAIRGDVQGLRGDVQQLITLLTPKAGV